MKVFRNGILLSQIIIIIFLTTINLQKQEIITQPTLIVIKNIKPTPQLEVKKTEYNKFTEGDNSKTKKIIWEISKEKNLNPYYILKICLIETGGTLDQNTLGVKTYCGRAKGIMQIMPSLEKHLKVGDIWDVGENITAGTSHLKWLIEKYSTVKIYDENENLINPEHVAAMAYNWGHSNIDKMLRKYKCIIIRKLPKETRRYYEKILNKGVY